MSQKSSLISRSTLATLALGSVAFLALGLVLIQKAKKEAKSVPKEVLGSLGEFMQIFKG